MILLRDYQKKTVENIFDSWAAGWKNVLAVQPTGTGKTVIFCFIIKQLNENNKKIAVIVHRKELLGQISLTLGRYGINHSIIAPNNVIKNICKLQYQELKKNYYVNNSNILVASVNTLLNRSIDYSSFDNWIIDEGHHVLKNNMWGKAVNLFSNSKGLGVTATPCRTDKKGLGINASGVYDILIDNEKDMRWYIDNGYLSEYKIYFPGKYIDMVGAKRGSNGDWTANEVIKRTEKAEIIGDIVEHYIRVAKGKRGLTFMPSIKLCDQVTKSFIDAGVPAATVNSNLPDNERFKIIADFKSGKLLQLVNVDIFSEGFDLPSVEIVSMGRKTASLGWYRQVIGRVLRPAQGKKYGIILDHVGNVMPEHGGHGLPDQKIIWSLEDGIKRSSGKVKNITKICAACTAVFNKFLKSCPYCGHTPESVERITPEMVDGDLTELDDEIIAELRKKVIHTQRSPEEIKNSMLSAGASFVAANSAAKWKRLEQESRNELKKVLKKYQIILMNEGYSFDYIYKQFYSISGFDIISIFSQNRKTMDITTERLLNEIGKYHSIRNKIESK